MEEALTDHPFWVYYSKSALVYNTSTICFIPIREIIMANDIQKSVSANAIKNGTVIVATCARNGNYKILDTYVSNKPTIAEIESKYDERFNDVGYYYLGNNTLVGG